MKRAPLYPLAVAVWLTILAWAQSSGGEGRWIDLATSIVAALTTASVGLLLAAAATANRDRRGLIALVVVLWSALFSDFVSIVPRAWRLSEGEGALLWTATAALAALMIRRLPVHPTLTRIATIAAGLLLAFQLVPIGSAMRSSHDSLPPNARVRPNMQDASRPDIYVIVLDKYTSTHWLSTRYGFDNRPSGGWNPAFIAGRSGIGLSQRMQSFTESRGNLPAMTQCLGVPR